MAKEMKKYKGYDFMNDERKKAERARQEQRRDAATKNAAGRPTFAFFATHDEEFQAACARAGIPPTARQASKWHRKRGLAWQNRGPGNG